MREVLKEEIEGLFLSARSRVFQQLGAVTEKARDPKKSFVPGNGGGEGRRRSAEDGQGCVCEENA